MNRRLSIDELLARHRPEKEHTKHVARLAMRIFDATGERLALKASDRRILEAAALLHDAGYRASPGDHAKTSARIVRSEGLRGFTKHEQSAITGAVLLHSGGPMPPVRALAPIPSASRAAALRAGAILRIADGLDHGHIQDCSITSVRFLPNTVTLMVSCRVYGGSIPHAGEKANLWNEVFPLNLVVASDDRIACDAGRLKGKTANSLRRRLCYAFRTAADCRARMVRHQDKRTLSLLRASLRDAAALLTLVDGRYPGHVPKTLATGIKDLIARSSHPLFRRFLAGSECASRIRSMAYFARITMNDITLQE